MLLTVAPLCGTIEKREGIVLPMNRKAEKTYEAIFADPIQSGVKWDDVEAMLLACGAKISEGSGSRIRVELNGVRAVFHRPHPQNTTDKGAVKSVRKLLNNAGVKK
jgi:hypothetical protein